MPPQQYLKDIYTVLYCTVYTKRIYEKTVFVAMGSDQNKQILKTSTFNGYDDVQPVNMALSIITT
jgi:hypothetical protein